MERKIAQELEDAINTSDANKAIQIIRDLRSKYGGICLTPTALSLFEAKPQKIYLEEKKPFNVPQIIPIQRASFINSQTAYLSNNYSSNEIYQNQYIAPENNFSTRQSTARIYSKLLELGYSSEIAEQVSSITTTVEAAIDLASSII